MPTVINFSDSWLHPDLPEATTDFTFGRPAFLSILIALRCNPRGHTSVSGGAVPGGWQENVCALAPPWGFGVKPGAAPPDGRGRCARRAGLRLTLGASQAGVRQAARVPGPSALPALYTKPRKTEKKKQKHSSAVSWVATWSGSRMGRNKLHGGRGVGSGLGPASVSACASCDG